MSKHISLSTTSKEVLHVIAFHLVTHMIQRNDLQTPQMIFLSINQSSSNVLNSYIVSDTGIHE